MDEKRREGEDVQREALAEALEAPRPRGPAFESEPDGVEREIVPVDSLAAEYEYIAAQRCDCGGGFQAHSQRLTFDAARRPCDEVFVMCAQCGKDDRFRFDISSFYGKPTPRQRKRMAAKRRRKGAAEDTQPDVT